MIGNPWAWLHQRLNAFHVPPELLQQSDSLGPHLPYEDVLDEGFSRPVVLLSDGAVALVWRLQLVSHEVMTNDEIEGLSRAVAQVFDALTDDDQVVQLVYDAMPAWTIDRPAYLAREGHANDGLKPSPFEYSAAQEVMAHRVRHLEQLAGGAMLGNAPFRTMVRELHITLRMRGVARERSLSMGLKRALLGNERARDEDARLFTEAVRRLLDVGLQIEDGLSNLGLQPRPCGGTDVLTLLRRAWHDEDELQYNPCTTVPYDPSRRLGDQVGKGFVRANRAGLQTGRDTWELVSWLSQPPSVSFGLFSLLMGIGMPMRLVLNLRPCSETTDLAVAKSQLSAPLLHSERKSRHLEELRYVEERQAHGEKLSWAGLHLCVKNEQTSLEELSERGAARAIAHTLAQQTGIELVVERDATAGLFMATQPLAYTPGTAWFTGRERRVLTSSLGPYLPLFGGFVGQQQQAHRVQLMHSRGADPLWSDVRRNETAPHLAVLASTGAGKSFYLANLLCAEAAAHPDALFFVVDSLTSYRVFGEVIGEDGGFTLVQPPHSAPNVWEGELSPERLGVLVGILRAAIGLVDPVFVFKNGHGTLLEGAVRKAFADRHIESRTTLRNEGDEDFEDALFVSGHRGRSLLPRLSDVVANLAIIAAEVGIPVQTVDELRVQLAPFYGQGRYASFFDAEVWADPSPATPTVTLYDFGAITDPLVRALTLFVCVAEVVRQVMRPENRGRPGVLLVDEAGVLLSQPGEAGAELVRFVQNAWKTFRKLGVSCIGSTNEPSDYTDKPGPRTIWFNSPTKVFLRLKPDDLKLARLGDRAAGRPALIDDDLLGDLAVSLRKVDGVYSQGLWVSDETRGTFTYVASGYDYWLAASKPIEVDSFLLAADVLGSRRTALHYLATQWPSGVRDASGQLRALQPHEPLLDREAEGCDDGSSPPCEPPGSSRAASPAPLPTAEVIVCD